MKSNGYNEEESSKQIAWLGAVIKNVTLQFTLKTALPFPNQKKYLIPEKTE